MMKGVEFLPMPKDRTRWVARFSGLRVRAFGKEQVLHAPIRFQVEMERDTPFEWTARAYPGTNPPFCRTMTAEEAMRSIQGLFVTVMEPWTAYSLHPFHGYQPIKPTVVKKVSKPE